MTAQKMRYCDVIDFLYDLPMDNKKEVADLLARKIIEDRRDEILRNGIAARESYARGELKFSDDINELKAMLQ